MLWNRAVASLICQLCFAVALICQAHISHAAIDDLIRTVPGPNPPYAAWGGQLFPVTDSDVLVGRGILADLHNEPVHLVDIHTGQIVQTYAAPAAFPGSGHFGTSVIQVGGHVLVGASTTDLSGTPVIEDAGVVHVYDAATGVYQRTIMEPVPERHNSFGYTMVPLGNLAVIGSSLYSAAHDEVYIVDPSTGGVVGTLENPSGNSGDRFGSALATIGGDILVGASEGGHAYRFDGATGALKQTYSHPLGASAWGFGASVVVSGDKVIVGALYDHLLATQGGAVYVYDADSGALLSTITSPSPSAYDTFGYKLGLLGDDILLVSELRLGVSTGSGVPQVLAFDLNTGDLLAEIAHPSPTPILQVQRFGEAVADVGGALVIGSPRGNYDSDDGPLYVYNGLIPEPCTASLLLVSGIALIKRGRRVPVTS